MRPLVRAFTACCLTTSFAACSGDAPRPKLPALPSLIDESSAVPVHDQQATWRFHPAHTARLSARAVIDASRTVFVGGRGERWLLDRTRGTARAAAHLAPETLVAVVPGTGGADYLFVGASGTSYEARDPLGAFVRSSAPPEPLAAVVASGTTLLGVRRDGGLLLSDDRGATYRSVGPERRFVDVAVDGAGNAFALAVPERLWRSSDLGKTWKELDSLAVGGYELGVVDPGNVVLRAVLGNYTVRADGKLDVRGAPTPAQGFALDVPLPRGPDAAAVIDERAALTGGRYYELERDTKKAYKLWSGGFAEPLAARPMAVLDGCEVVRLGAYDRWIYVACARGSGVRAEQLFSFYASRDGGATFDVEPYQAQGVASLVRLAVGAEGRLLVTGICAQGDKANCARGVYYRRPVAKADRSPASRVAPKKNIELGPAATPSLSATALAVAYAAHGGRAYAVARRTKGGALALYVSEDGGATFQARDLDEIQNATPPGDTSESSAPSDPQAMRVVALRPASDGSVAIVIANPSLLIVTDEAGRVLSVSRPPEPEVDIGAVGTRAVAIAESGDSRAWESLDGGVSWQAIGRAPLPLCADEHCETTIACGAAGCVVGSEFSRVGWQGQSDEETGVQSPPEATGPRLFRHKLGVAFGCTLDEGAWRPLASAIRVPAADSAAIGRAAWFVPAFDPLKASAWVYHGFGGAHPKVERETLLAPPPNPGDWASFLAPQIEGAAALRYLIPERRPGESRLTDIEVGWDNLVENTVLHGTLATGVEYQIGDYKSGGRFQLADPHLVSVASGGLYVRVHHSDADRQPTYFFDGRSVTSIPGVNWDAESLAGKSEMFHVGHEHVPVHILGDGVAFVRAESKGQAWTFSAQTVGLVNSQPFGVEEFAMPTYVSGRPAWAITSRENGGTRMHAFAYPVRADGNVFDAPIPIPTQIDAGDTPKRCAPEQRTSTPRTVAMYGAGTRHLVQIVDPSEPVRNYLTDSAVLYGTPESACVAAYDAASVAVDPQQSGSGERAILTYDDLEHAWLFRVTTSGEGGIEVRNMTCHADPTLEAPAAVYRAPGTLAE